ncbi:DUF6000 family protein [Streptomyces virginiae]|uniref:DUF6000 family protein n=1 Tax=Streptomyces virginiae TaxID=1961 RepID=UPI003686CE17
MIARVRPGGRYLELDGSLMGMTEHDRSTFLRELGEDARAITPHELTVLLEGGWRERLGEMLLASEVCFAGSAYCVALATFATAADADLPAAYLDRYLRRPDLDYDQPAAMGALLHLDAELDTDHAARFLTADGPWHQWIDGPPHKKHHDTPDSHREAIGRLCAFAEESAEHRPAGKHGVVREFRAEAAD